MRTAISNSLIIFSFLLMVAGCVKKQKPHVWSFFVPIGTAFSQEGVAYTSRPADYEPTALKDTELPCKDFY